MATLLPEKHIAVATPAPRAPLVLLEVSTIPPIDGEITVHVQWAASTPLHLHQADGGLLVKHPYIMGGDFAGTVVAVGPPSRNQSASEEIEVGDAVFGFAFAEPRQESHQTYITVPLYLLGKIPPNLSMQEAVTVPANLVTAFHTITHDLGLPLPWPIPETWAPPESVRNAAVVIWGAGSSVGSYSVQVLRHWGYRNIVAVASTSHHPRLRELGAAECFDYRHDNVVQRLKRHVSETQGLHVPFIIDCIGSLEGTLRPLTGLAEQGTRIAVMLPVIMKHASKTDEPIYEMDVTKCLPTEWKDGVELRGTRTHFYSDVSLVSTHKIDIMVGTNPLEERVLQISSSTRDHTKVTCRRRDPTK